MIASQSGIELTKNQKLVYHALETGKGPLSAYTILDNLHGKGLRAPLQVYRALDKLVEMGLVHRLESLNAFIACNHPECETHETTAFMICEKCDCVSELADDGLKSHLKELSSLQKFTLKKTILELRGVCGNCK